MIGLLWKPEAMNLLEDCGITKGFKTKPKWAIYDKLRSVCTMDQVRSALLSQYRRHGDGR
jgi:hypothetical protein